MTKQLKINSIQVDREIQSRERINPVTIESYAQDIKDGAAFPPVTVFKDGKTYYLADGFHRLQACQEIGKDTISAEVHQGNKRNAILFSVGANAKNGLHRTNGDKRRAVETLLKDPEWSKWADREIAKRCCVSPNMVKAHRDRLSAQNAQIGKSTTRIVKRGGTVYEQKIERIGRAAPPTRITATRVSGDAPRKGDGPDYLSFQAKVYLKGIDPMDPAGARALRKIWVWINERLREAGEDEAQLESTAKLTRAVDESGTQH